MLTSDQWPEPLRRQLGLPCAANPAIAQIKSHMFGNSRRYVALVLAASAGEEVDPEDLLEAARLAGKTPAIVNFDLDKAAAVYRLWQESVDP